MIKIAIRFIDEFQVEPALAVHIDARGVEVYELLEAGC